MIGRLNNKEEIKMVKEGTSLNGKKWVLYSQALEIDGKYYQVSGFDKEEIEKMTSPYEPNDFIEFSYDLDKGKYKKINKLGRAKGGETSTQSNGVQNNTVSHIDFMRECIDDAKKACLGHGFSNSEIQKVAVTFYLEKRRR